MDCEKDLSQCMPQVQKALKSLDTLDDKDIGEIKGYSTAPKLLEPVIKAVCLLLGESEDFKMGQKLMSEPKKFKAQLQNYPKDKIPDKTVKKLQKYIKDPNFEPDIIHNVSKAGKSICLWVRAMNNYSAVMKIVKPKKKALAKAEAELKVAKDELSVKEAALQKIRDKIAGL